MGDRFRFQLPLLKTLYNDLTMIHERRNSIEIYRRIVMGKLLTTEDVAELLQMSERSVYRYLHNGELEAAKVGGEWRIKQEDLDKFIEEKKASTKRTQAMGVEE